MKIWKVKEERLGAKICRLQKRLENIVNSKLIPSSLKSKMIMDLKEKINECEVEAGIVKGNKEVEALNKIEKELMKKLDMAQDRESEEKILAELEFVLEEETAKRNEVLSEARGKYSQNKAYIDRMRKIRGHKSPEKITMTEIKKGDATRTTENYSRYDRENNSDERMAPSYRNSEVNRDTTRPAYERPSAREDFGESNPRENDTKREERGNTENRQNKKKHYNKKERLEKLVEIAKTNGISYKEWETELAKGRAEEKCEGINKSISEVDELIASLKREINKEERNKIGAETKIENLTTELKEIQEFKNRAEKRAQKSKDELDKFSKDKEAEKQKELEEANKKLENANKKLKNVQEDLKTTGATKDASTKKIEELKKELEAAQKLREELGEQYSVAKQELDEIINGSSKDELPKYEEVPLVTKQRETKEIQPEQEETVGAFNEAVQDETDVKLTPDEKKVETAKKELSEMSGEAVRTGLHQMIINGEITSDDLKAVLAIVEKTKNAHENGPAPTKQKDDRESVGE